MSATNRGCERKAYDFYATPPETVRAFLANFDGISAAFIDWRNLPAMTDAIQMAGWVWRGVIVWDKGVSRNIPGRFRNDCEYIVWGTNGRKEVDWKAAKGAMGLPEYRAKWYGETEEVAASKLPDQSAGVLM